MTLNLESLAIVRAEEQMGSASWKIDGSEAWELRGPHRCTRCGNRTHAHSALCRACKRKFRREHCFACSRRAQIKGYCRDHWDQIRNTGVVESSLVLRPGEGKGAPKGESFVSWRHA